MATAYFHFVYFLLLTAGEVSPSRRVTLQMVEGITLRAKVVGPNGEAVPRIPVTFSFDHPHAGTTYGPPSLTDEQGLVQFENVNPAAGEYSISIDLRGKYQRTNAKLRTDGRPTVIRLEKGIE